MSIYTDQSMANFINENTNKLIMHDIAGLQADEGTG